MPRIKSNERKSTPSRNTRKIAKLESDTRSPALGAVQVERENGARFLVSVKSYRRRLLDEDNLCEKYFVDLCRYAGIIPGDEAETTKIEVGQEKVGKEEEEKTVIDVVKL